MRVKKKKEMPKLYREDYKIGAVPGTVSVASTTPVTQSVITLIDYNLQSFQEKQLQSVEETFPFKETTTVSWINIDGKNPEIVSKIQSHFGVHPLVLEDILSTSQQPKVEDYEDYLFLVLRMIDFDTQTNEIKSEQISLVLGKTYVISFQETLEGDVFDSVRDRIRHAKGRVRTMGADYLAYSLLDAIVDRYFVVLDKIGQRIDALEDQLMADNSPEIPYKIHQLKRQIIYLRKQIWPLREVLNIMTRTPGKLVGKATSLFLRDAYDHTIQVTETIEAFREALSAMQDIYLSSVNYRMNEIMKVLTVITTIFIPLSFIVGIYGMNFEHMPELGWKWGYEFAWGLIVCTAGAMIYFFKKRKWF